MEHIPVLKNEVLKYVDYINSTKSGYFVDGTLGFAGHSLAIAKKNKKIKIIGIDKDGSTLKTASDKIKKAKMFDQFVLINDDFKNINAILAELKIEKIEGALIDLGVSSFQLDDKTRGFSFSDPEMKLDMRMDQTQELDAVLILNHYPESRLEKILREYGEEKFSRQIARNICQTRKEKHLETVGDLLWILERSIPKKIRATGKIHFATKTFQALRIEVNKELEDLERSLRDIVEHLSQGSRLLVISFHSLEDRIVKNTFREMASSCSCPPAAPVCVCSKKQVVKILTKRPIQASEEEITNNPRSRSAKFRVVEKL